jgi:hypothetical protein
VPDGRIAAIAPEASGRHGPCHRLLTASCPADSVDINLLLGQEITVELTCVTGDWPVTDLVVACSGTLSTVVLEVDGQVPEVVATTNRVDSTRR